MNTSYRSACKISKSLILMFCSLRRAKSQQHTHLILSYEHRLFLIPRRDLPTSEANRLHPTSHMRIVVEPSSLQSLAANCPFLQYLGFNHVPSKIFFPFSQHSRSGVSHPSVVVILALGDFSNSSSSLINLEL